MIDKFAVFIATGLGSGFAPKAPGTIGSLAVIPFIWAYQRFAWTTTENIIALILISILGVWSTARVEAHWKTHDDQRIVIDEFAGMFMTLVWFPFDAFHVAAGFTLFRLFDIWKPGPVGYIDEHAPGAWGTFFDDIVAGVFAAVCLHFISTYAG